MYIHITVDRVILSGRLDTRSASRVRVALNQVIDIHDGDITVDIHDVEVADPAGLGVLVGAQKRAERQGGRLILTKAPLNITRQLKTVGLNQLIDVNTVSLPVAECRSLGAPDPRSADAAHYSGA